MAIASCLESSPRSRSPSGERLLAAEPPDGLTDLHENNVAGHASVDAEALRNAAGCGSSLVGMNRSSKILASLRNFSY